MELLEQLTYPIVLVIHLVGVAMGVGGAVTTDATFLRSIWDRKITAGQLQLIEIISKVVITGLGLLILSGVSLVALNSHYFSLSDGSQLFWVKMTIVAILTANGVVFHKKILPMLQRHKDTELNTAEVRNKLWLLAITGGLSGISWFTVLTLGVVMQSVDFSYVLIMNVYLLLVLGAVVTGYFGIYWILFSKLRGAKPTSSNNTDLPKKTKFPWLNSALMVLVVLAVLVIGLFFNDDNDGHAADKLPTESFNSQSTHTHEEGVGH